MCGHRVAGIEVIGGGGIINGAVKIGSFIQKIHGFIIVGQNGIGRGCGRVGVADGCILINIGRN